MTWLSALLLLLASLTHPHAARCGAHWWLSEGVRPSGLYVCALLDGPDTLWPIAPAIESRVYCSGGTSPIVVRGVAVACQRGGYP